MKINLNLYFPEIGKIYEIGDLLKYHGLLKCKHTTNLCSNKREYLYDFENIMAKLKTVLSLVYRLTGRSILWHAIMENGAIFYRHQFARLLKGFEPSRVPTRRLDELALDAQLLSFCCSFDILIEQAGNPFSKDKKWHPGKYLFHGTTLLVQRVTCDMIIRRSRTLMAT